jgi:putative tricarboxylic transport membrane protein
MRERGKTPIAADLFWFVFAAAVCLESWNVQVGSFHKPGPGFAPFLAGLCLGLLSLISLFQSLKEKKREEGAGVWTGVHFGKLGLLLAVLLLYAVLLDTLGFLVGTLLLMLCLFRMVSPYSWRIVLLASFLATAATYILFVVLLETQLPPGILAF